MTEPSYEQALNTLEETFKDRIRRPTGENETKSGVLASVLPRHAQEVELLAREASRYSMPLAAVGGGTSPEPAAEEGKLLVRFDLMRGVRLPHRGGMGRGRARDAVAQVGRGTVSQGHGSRGLSHHRPLR